MIEIQNLSIDLGEFHLRNVNFSVKEGEYMALLGPTGVGKTVLVECIAGIHKLKNGKVLVDGNDITFLYPEERNIGYVPQDYALFPNMTVKENIAYGLHTKGLSKQQIEKSCNSMLSILKLEHLSHRLPLNLSGGEKQRVALGRSLITKPHILLLDEPLSAVDENMRNELTEELHQIHQTLKGTFLHVCHSFEEASSVADRIAVMLNGTIVQVGTIDEILNKPQNQLVAQFTCTRNILHGNAEINETGSKITITKSLKLFSKQKMKGKVIVAVRPENIQCLTDKSSMTHADNIFKGKINRIRRKSTHFEIEVENNDGVKLVIYTQTDDLTMKKNLDDGIVLHIPPENIIVFSEIS